VARFELSTFIAAPIELVFDLARDIDVHQRGMAHSNETAIEGTTTGLIGLDGFVTWQARHLGITWTLTSRITAFEPPKRFVDEQSRGPFRSFRHEHRFDSVPGGTRMLDDWRHQAPFGLVGSVVDRLVLRRYLRRALRIRNRELKREAESRAQAVQGGPGRSSGR
jgi:ligand-binding SRPBCC domain-containing protein